MWIYQQNHTFTDQAAESVRQLPVPAVQGNCCSPEPGREPESQIRTVSLKKRRGPMAEKDLWLLAVAVLSGTAAAGVIRALCSGFQLEWLNAYLNIWLNCFTDSGTHTAALFAAEYFTLATAATVLLLSGFSAFGPALISLFLMLYGTGDGLLMLHLLNGTSWKEKLLVILFTALPSSIAESCLCILSASALRVSEKLREYSFRRSIPAKSRPDTSILIRQYLLTLALFVPLCGAACGMACIESRLL